MNPTATCLAAGAAAIALLALTSRAAPPLAYVNESPSLPKGLYLRRLDPSLRRGVVVVVAQPPAVRGYLAGLRMPGDVRLIKRVVAVGGDPVCARDGALAWPGGTARALSVDRRGAPLPAWRGCRRLAADELFLLGDTPTSFDSRYFGPVRAAEVKGVYREMLTW